MNRKFALVIGNSDYDDQTLAKLKTPGADVRALAEILRDPVIGGFDYVTAVINRFRTEVGTTLGAFFAQKKPDDLLLLYFSGHGVLDDRGRLFLAVKDTQRDLLKFTAIAASDITDEMDACRSKRQVLILDCCHSGAFARGTKGDAKAMNATTFEGCGYGRIVLTASDSTQYALEGDQVIAQAELSLFTHYLLQGLQTGEADTDGDGRITLDELYDYVYTQISNQTHKQTPQKWGYKLQGELLIARNPRPKEMKPAALPFELRQAIESPLAGIRAAAVEELSHLLRGSDQALAAIAAEALMRLKNDDSRKVSDAAAAILAAPADARPAPIEAYTEVQRPAEKLVEPQPLAQPAATEKFVATPCAETIAPPKITPQIITIERPIRLEFVRIPAAEFLMGSDPVKDKRAGYHDQPQHLVYVSKFYIGRYPVTNAEYAAFVNATGQAFPEHWKGAKVPAGKENHPVVNVSCHDAVAFCNWLSHASSQNFRLPTEAEWEKAARGKEGRIYPWGNDWDCKKANCKESGAGDTTPVEKYSPASDSPYGVADMIGNIWEWCSDWYAEKEYWRRSQAPVKNPQGPENGNGRVIRGGSFCTDNPHVRCAYRGHQPPSQILIHLGFRVVCSSVRLLLKNK